MDRTERLRAAMQAHNKGDYNAALDQYAKVLNENFDDGEVLHYVGTLFHQMGYNGIGASLFSRSLQVNKNHLDSLINLGAAYFKEWNLEGAKEIWQLAREQFQQHRPGDKEAICGLLCNLAGAYVHGGEYAEAIPYYEEALKQVPGSVTALGNLGMAQLAVGDWSGGWKNYDYHLEMQTRKPRQYITKAFGKLKEWQGHPNDSVIVYGEQGVGDEIMYASMIPDLKKRVRKVTFDCHPRLENLFKRSFPGIEIHGTRKTTDCPWVETSDATTAIAVGSLGKFFRNKREEFLGAPYLKSRTGHKPGKTMKVGISWKGGTKGTATHLRSFPIETFAPLVTAFPEIEWHSLQYHADASDEVLRAQEATGMRLKHLPRTLTAFDYDETADLVASMDLIITVPTSVLHVAGALGVPCWVLVQKEAAWRETGNVSGRGGEMPWYKSATLIHKETDTWEPVIMRVINKLADLQRLREPEQTAA